MARVTALMTEMPMSALRFRCPNHGLSRINVMPKLAGNWMKLNPTLFSDRVRRLKNHPFRELCRASAISAAKMAGRSIMNRVSLNIWPTPMSSLFSVGVRKMAILRPSDRTTLSGLTSSVRAMTMARTWMTTNTM